MSPSQVIVILVALLSSPGCVYLEYRDYLYSLPVTERQHAGQAVGIVADVFGIDARSPEVRWVVQDDPILTLDGRPALGITHDCDSWVWWPPGFGSDPVTSTQFGFTSMAHEIAHCALWLYGYSEGDNDHSDVEWWGGPGEGQVGGLVGIAMKTLQDKGL
jgi:hypothetical protein